MNTPRGVLTFGSETIKALVPHRPPLLMVDRVTAIDPEDALIKADRYISANEPVFAGHFPDRSIWPGIYTIEGLGQSSHILQAVLQLKGQAEAAAKGWPDVIDALHAHDLQARNVVGPPVATDSSLFDFVLAPRIGLSGAVDIKFCRPVYAGERLHYRVRRTHVVNHCTRFSVVAEVGGECVARGTMTGALGAQGRLRT